MPLRSLTTFSPSNRRMILLLVVSHLVWGCAVVGLWAFAQLLGTASPWIAPGFIALQFWGAAQLLLPVLRLHPEARSRGFYLFWGGLLVLGIWLVNQLNPGSTWAVVLAVLKSSLLLLAATLTGAAMARYVRHLWELVPVCLVMTFADFASWLHGPTAFFARQIERHYLAPAGPPPLVDMLLVKMVLPGQAGLAPVFGVADWIMVVFFAMVARRHGVNDNLAGAAGESVARHGRIGAYLPVPVVALFLAVMMAQLTGLFVPALPVIALIMLVWYALRYFVRA